jgi:cytochrome c-type biogenesis protein CcmH/NrfG
MQVHLAMALHRRAAELEQSAPQLQRPRIIRVLRQGLRRGVPTAAGWLCLAGLYRKDRNPSEALWAARMVLSSLSTWVLILCFSSPKCIE